MSDIDVYGDLDRQIKELEAIRAKFKAKLLPLGVGKHEGSKYVLEVQHYDRATINPILVREFADEEFIRNVTQIKPVDALVVKPL
jgi:hypothetical protein